MQERHPAFDIHVYGAGVINEFERRPSKSSEILMSHSVISLCSQVVESYGFKILFIVGSHLKLAEHLQQHFNW